MEIAINISLWIYGVIYPRKQEIKKPLAFLKGIPMTKESINFSEILLSSIDEFIKKIGQGISEAQIQLDLAALKGQQSLKDTHKELAEIGYQVPWYYMPEVTVELKIAVHYEEEKQQDGLVKRRIFLSPYNAKYKNTFSYDAEGSSNIKLLIKPVPPSTIHEPHE